MTVRKQICLVLFSFSLLACSGGGSGSLNSPPDRVVTTPEEEAETVISENAFVWLPIRSGAEWQYDNGDVTRFSGSKDIAGVSVAPLTHTIAGWADEEYFYTDDDNLYFAGLYSSLITLPFLGELAGQLSFNSPWGVYTSSTDQGSGGGLFPLIKNVVVTSEPDIEETFPLTLRSTVASKELVFVPQFGDVPAMRLDITMGIPTVFNLETSIWLSPGLGIVARQTGDATSTLTQVMGLPDPVIFVFDEGEGLAQAPKQLMWNGEVITDDQWAVSIGYVTEERSWLTVEFDGSGSWRASIDGEELPQGLHAAVLTLTQGEAEREITVSVLVQ